MEASVVAGEWLQAGNEQVDKILVTSKHSKDSYENTTVQATNNQTGEVVNYKLETPVEIVHEHVLRVDPQPIEEFEPECDFNFLVVSQAGPRKNLDNTIKWWVEEFHDQEVGLIVKTNHGGNSIGDSNRSYGALKKTLEEYTDRKCKVYLLHGDLDRGQLTWLYNHDKVKSMINISHGEGFGLPLFEAAREGLPIITVPWSGQLDFLSHDGVNYFKAVKHELRPVQQEAVWNGVIRPDASWAYADQGSYKMALRDVLKNWESHKSKATELQAILETTFSREIIEKKFVDGVLGFDSSMLAKQEDEPAVMEFD